MRRRRRLLLQSLAATLAPLPHFTLAATIQSGTNPATDHETLRALLDTLIPADETPAASAVGVDQVLLEMVRRDEGYRRLIERGTAWLNSSARALGAKSFVVATEEQRIAVIGQAERERAGTLPRLLFKRIRSDALELYYAQPMAWTTLSYAGPPQPNGFPDFERPPAARR